MIEAHIHKVEQMNKINRIFAPRSVGIVPPCKRTPTNLYTVELTRRSGLTALSPMRVLSTLITELDDHRSATDVDTLRRATP